MKKMILTVAFVIATIGMAQANLQKNYKLNEPKKIETVSDVVAANDSTPHIISFYDVERIVIKNDTNVLIRIYDTNWKLIKETTGNVNLYLTPGNYFVASEKKIKTRYISSN